VKEGMGNETVRSHMESAFPPEVRFLARRNVRWVRRGVWADDVDLGRRADPEFGWAKRAAALDPDEALRAE
jgi:hypothetical protein